MAVPSDNGGWPSDGGSPDDLPDLPEEWGVIVIPDDLSVDRRARTTSHQCSNTTSAFA